MPKKEIPAIDIVNMVRTYTKETVEAAIEQCDKRARNYEQNYEILSKLCKAGIIPPDEVSRLHVQHGHTVKISSKNKLSKARRALDVNLMEIHTALVDAKTRMIRAVFKSDKHPESDVYLEIVRRYTKAEEATRPCKIQKVVTREAQEARPAVIETRLVCNVS